MLRARAFESVQHKLRKDCQSRKGATRRTNENRCHEAKTYATQTMVEIFERYGLQCPDLCDLILIMISIPSNSGWVERAYSYLDQVCQKKRNRLDVGNLKELLF